MAPDARRHPRSVHIEASAVTQGAHERIRDLCLALAAEIPGVWIAAAWACCAADVADVWSDKHVSSLFQEFPERERTCAVSRCGLLLLHLVQARRGRERRAGVCARDERVEQSESVSKRRQRFETNVFPARHRFFLFLSFCISLLRGQTPPPPPPPPCSLPVRFEIRTSFYPLTKKASF